MSVQFALPISYHDNHLSSGFHVQCRQLFFPPPGSIQSVTRISQAFDIPVIPRHPAPRETLTFIFVHVSTFSYWWRHSKLFSVISTIFLYFHVFIQSIIFDCNDFLTYSPHKLVFIFQDSIQALFSLNKQTTKNFITLLEKVAANMPVTGVLMEKVHLSLLLLSWYYK